MMGQSHFHEKGRSPRPHPQGAGPECSNRISSTNVLLVSST